MSKWLEKRFKPDLISSGVDQIDYEKLYSDGIRLLLLDIDNTLAIHGSKMADEYAHEAIQKMKSAGLQVFILSNAKKKRAQSFADSLKLEAEGMANKPSGKVLLEVCTRFGIDPQNSCMIGDQIFTDVWAARKAGTKSILVRPRSLEESPHIKLKRKLENMILNKIGSQ